VIDAAAQFAGFLEGDPWAGPERGTGGLQPSAGDGGAPRPQGASHQLL